jgi:hypothetical protein
MRSRVSLDYYRSDLGEFVYFTSDLKAIGKQEIGRGRKKQEKKQEEYKSN